jgi:hypothetical protein
MSWYVSSDGQEHIDEKVCANAKANKYGKRRYKNAEQHDEQHEHIPPRGLSKYK